MNKKKHGVHLAHKATKKIKDKKVAQKAQDRKDNKKQKHLQQQQEKQQQEKHHGSSAKKKGKGNAKPRLKPQPQQKKKSANRHSDEPIKKSQLRGQDLPTGGTDGAGTASMAEIQMNKISETHLKPVASTAAPTHRPQAPILSSSPSSSPLAKPASTTAPSNISSNPIVPSSASASSSTSINPDEPDENGILYTIAPCPKDPNPFQKIACFSSIHPGFIFSATITILFFIYYVCFSKRSPARRFRPGFVSAFRRSKQSQRAGGDDDDDDAGEYAALTLYDDLLDDFDRDDLSSYAGDYSVNSVFESSGDDESVGTIISQWSDLNLKGAGSQKQRIEMIPFNDGNLTLNEING